MYYGEEIGMKNNDPTRKEDVKDPIGKLGWPEQKGRDGERTPMQWNGSPNAGFTTGIPWLPVPMTYQTHNVEAEKKDPNSILNFYKNLLALRHTNAALLDGDYVAVNQSDSNVYSYLRRYKGQAVLVVLNLSANPQKRQFRSCETGIQQGRSQDSAQYDQRRCNAEAVGYFSTAVHGVYRRIDEVVGSETMKC